MDPQTEHGVRAWASARWRAGVMAWMDQRLAAAGIERTGDASPPRVRAWSAVLSAPTTAGRVWLKAMAPATAFEAPLYELLARRVPDRVLVPIATDVDRGWILLPDGGPTLGDRRTGAALVDPLADAVAAYGRLQRAVAADVDALLGAGVADMRPAAIPERLQQALRAVGEDAWPDRGRVEALAPRVAAWSARRAAAPGPASLDHNDLHPWNVLGEDAASVRFYDWGDSVVAHPFAVMLVPLGVVRSALDARLDDPRLLRVRDAYLDGFADLAPHAALVDTLELACRLAKIARALTWDRALRSARDQGQPVEPRFAAATRETLASLLEDSYLGGA